MRVQNHVPPQKNSARHARTPLLAHTARPCRHTRACRGSQIWHALPSVGEWGVGARAAPTRPPHTDTPPSGVCQRAPPPAAPHTHTFHPPSRVRTNTHHNAAGASRSCSLARAPRTRVKCGHRVGGRGKRTVQRPPRLRGGRVGGVAAAFAARHVGGDGCGGVREEGSKC